MTDPSLMETLDDEGSGYPELAGYRLYGQISLQVHRHDINAEVLPAPTGGDAMISEALQDGCRADPEPFPHGRGGHPLAGVHANEDPFRDPNFLHITVQSVDVSVFQGECFNLTVEETNTYVSAGVVNKNCQCQVTRVPEGWAFNDAWDLVPAETLTEGDGEGEEEEKSLRPRAAADRMEKARKLAYRTTFRGLPISIENRKGSKRHWYDPHTKTHGETLMRLPYGYIRLTEAADGDHVDCFLGPHEEATHVYVVHQRKAPHFDEPDEDKVMLGQLSAARAKRAYLQHFDNPKFFGSMTAIPIERFVEHCKSGEYRDGKEIRKAEPARKMSQQTAFTWAPAPGSKKGAVRRRRPGGGWDYQYPPFTIPKHPETHRGQGIYWARQQEVNRSMAADPIATVSTIYLNVSGGGERARFVPVSGDTPLADRNLGVQITAHEVPKSAKAIERFAQHAKRSNLRLMVDSGEFPRFAAEMSIPPARAKLVDLERGHDAAAIAAAKAKLEKLEAKAKPLDFDRIFSDYERLADAFPSGTLTVVAPDRIGDAEETARIRAQYHDKIAEIVKRGVKLIVPFQSSTAEGLGAEYVAASEAFGEGTFVIGLPMAKKPMPMDVMVPFVTDLYRAGRFPKLHFLGGSHPERMAERTAQLVSAAYWSSRGLPKARVLELCATPRESLRSMSRVKSASDVLTDEAEAVLRPRMLKWAKAEGIDTEDETELWVQFFDAHPEEFDLEFAEKEGAFREWAQELVQFDTSTVNRAVIFRKQHALTGEQELVEGYLEEKEKKERHPGTLDRYLQAKEFQLERFVPSERSGIESLYGRYDKSYLPRWRDLVKSGQFRGSAGQIQSRREVGTMGNVGQPARTAGENTYGAQPTTDHPYGPDARKKKRKKKRKKQDRTAEKKRMAFSPVSYTDGYVRDKPTVDLDLESDAERNREWVDNAQDARAARLTGRRLTVRPQDMRS
ncbi:MAG: hypothetical protein KJN79_00620 [Gammaproteobacteria bacterium]|nr:hypothetical protein [Gammaproteobacteria bacterium]